MIIINIKSQRPIAAVGPALPFLITSSLVLTPTQGLSPSQLPLLLLSAVAQGGRIGWQFSPLKSQGTGDWGNRNGLLVYLYVCLLVCLYGCVSVLYVCVCLCSTVLRCVFFYVVLCYGVLFVVCVVRCYVLMCCVDIALLCRNVLCYDVLFVVLFCIALYCDVFCVVLYIACCVLLCIVLWCDVLWCVMLRLLFCVVMYFVMLVVLWRVALSCVFVSLCVHTRVMRVYFCMHVCDGVCVCFDEHLFRCTHVCFDKNACMCACELCLCLISRWNSGAPFCIAVLILLAVLYS